MLKRGFVAAVGFFTVIYLSFLYSSGQSQPGPTDLKSYLPSDKDIREWHADGLPQDFKGDDLYLYIDGGAEIYREYGFEQVVVQDYKNLGGKGFSLEIFRMSNPEAAFGMYTFKKSPKGKVMSIGAEGQMEDYYLNFWKGSCLITLTGFESDPKTIEGLILVAGLVDKKIQDVAKRPSLVAALPGEGLLETSVRYFRGYLGFMNLYSSLGKEELGVREGVRGDYGVGCSLFILRYQSEQESRARFSAAEMAIGKSFGSKESQPADAPLVRLKDDHGKFLSLRRLGNYILLCLEDPGSDRSSELFEAVDKSI